MRRYVCDACRTKQKIKDDQVTIKCGKHYGKCVKCGSTQWMLTAPEIRIMEESNNDNG